MSLTIIGLQKYLSGSDSGSRVSSDATPVASGFAAMAEPIDAEMQDSLEQQDDPEVLASQCVDKIWILKVGGYIF